MNNKADLDFVKDGRIDVALVMARIREKVRGRRDQGLYTDEEVEELTALKLQAFADEAEIDPELLARLMAVDHNWNISVDYRIETHRAGLSGPLIVFFKKLVRPFVRLYTDNLLSRQAQINLYLRHHRHRLPDLAERPRAGGVAGERRHRAPLPGGRPARGGALRPHRQPGLLLRAHGRRGAALDGGARARHPRAPRAPPRPPGRVRRPDLLLLPVLDDVPRPAGGAGEEPARPHRRARPRPLLAPLPALLPVARRHRLQLARGAGAHPADHWKPGGRRGRGGNRNPPAGR